MKCLRDDKQCYIHHDPETGFEVRCRHFDLTIYGGVCPYPNEGVSEGGSVTVGKASSGGDESKLPKPSKGLTILPSLIDSREPAQDPSIDMILDHGVVTYRKETKP